MPDTNGTCDCGREVTLTESVAISFLLCYTTCILSLYFITREYSGCHYFTVMQPFLIIAFLAFARSKNIEINYFKSDCF